jgi:hypothetical protein
VVDGLERAHREHPVLGVPAPPLTHQPAASGEPAGEEQHQTEGQRPGHEAAGQLDLERVADDRREAEGDEGGAQDPLVLLGPVPSRRGSYASLPGEREEPATAMTEAAAP